MKDRPLRQHPGQPSSERERVEALVAALGLEATSFYRSLEWILSEQLTMEMVRQVQEDKLFFQRRDALKLFRNLLRSRTGRVWSLKDCNRLYERVKAECTRQFREPITYEDLALLSTRPLACERCGATPPQAKIHIDHVVPASKGGSSRLENLRYLCEPCNLRKSNKKEVGQPWLDLD